MKIQEVMGGGLICMRIWQGGKKGLPNLGYKMMVSKGSLGCGLEEGMGTFSS